MKYFEQLMVERSREHVVRLKTEIEVIDAEIAALHPIRWAKKRQLNQFRKGLLIMVRSLESEIGSVTG